MAPLRDTARDEWIARVRVSHDAAEVADECLKHACRHMADAIINGDFDGPTQVGEDYALHHQDVYEGDDCTIPEWVWTLAAIAHSHYEIREYDRATDESDD